VTRPEIRSSQGRIFGKLDRLPTQKHSNDQYEAISSSVPPGDRQEIGLFARDESVPTDLLVPMSRYSASTVANPEIIAPAVAIAAEMPVLAHRTTPVDHSSAWCEHIRHFATGQRA
jgi:hypothetical protein